MTAERKPHLFVKKPAFRDGTWCVVVAESPSPLAAEVEVVPCGSRESAYQAYRQIMKDLGRGY